MKRALVALFVICFSTTLLSAPSNSDNWSTDIQSALKEAKSSGKYVLMDFTGSDWCGWCIKLNKEVFKQDAFIKFAEKNLVLVELDFPKKKKVDPATKKQNEHWMNIFGVKGFPTVMLCDPDGRPVQRFGYRKGGAQGYIDFLADLIAKDKQMLGNS